MERTVYFYCSPVEWKPAGPRVAADRETFGLCTDHSMMVGEACRVAIDGRQGFDSLAVVRHVSRHRVGFEITQRLPVT